MHWFPASIAVLVGIVLFLILVRSVGGREERRRDRDLPGWRHNGRPM